MNKSRLDRISIQNFKGIANAEFEFENNITIIKAENGAGKTTIKNAFEWLLCQNVADVLPMLNNKEIPNLTTHVVARLNINDYDYTFERECKGKYSLNKETGKMNKVMNVNTFKIDEMEYKEKDYQEKIANLLGSGAFENLQILTDKEYFNTDTTKFKWTDRRKILFEMCEVKNAVSTIIEKPEYSNIKEYIVKGHATSDIKSMLRKNKSGYKDQQTKNNILIEQKITENTEIAKIDFEKTESDLKLAKEKLATLLSATDIEKQNAQLNELKEKLFALTKEKSSLESADLSEQSTLRKTMQEVYNETQNLKFRYNLERDKIANLTTQLKNLAEEECPVCHHKLEQEQIDKANKEIEEQNKDTQFKIDFAKENMTDLKERYDKKKTIFEETKAKLDNFKPNEKINELNQSISATTTAIEQAKSSELSNLSKEQQTALETQISALEREMAKKTYFEENEKLIQKWKDNNKELADLIVGVEQKEYALERYVKEQTDIIIETVNSHFSNGVSWSLYKETYKNGEGGIEEDCICMYNGKRYSSLSMGEKNTANLEVIKALQEYYGVLLPIFCDNQESVTIPYDSAERQIIELRATENEKLDGIVKITDLYKGE